MLLTIRREGMSSVNIGTYETGHGVEVPLFLF